LFNSKLSFSRKLCIACTSLAAWLVFITPFSPVNTFMVIPAKINKIIIATINVTSATPFVFL